MVAVGVWDGSCCEDMQCIKTTEQSYVLLGQRPSGEFMPVTYNEYIVLK